MRIQTRRKDLLVVDEAKTDELTLATDGDGP
ncbi:hypothetical protein HNQ96_001198 [Aminobacter lissarensis]|uniref:Uncharacterized protein n=1 Tax=Aminobacter carboxidus TaxID=376165 RepID=A0A8E2BAB3_9HYPH|nr:hypothetical protein [Aminobacter lissarensis]